MPDPYLLAGGTIPELDLRLSFIAHDYYLERFRRKTGAAAQTAFNDLLIRGQKLILLDNRYHFARFEAPAPLETRRAVRNPAGMQNRWNTCVSRPGSTQIRTVIGRTRLNSGIESPAYPAGNPAHNRI